MSAKVQVRTFLSRSWEEVFILLFIFFLIKKKINPSTHPHTRFPPHPHLPSNENTKPDLRDYNYIYVCVLPLTWQQVLFAAKSKKLFLSLFTSLTSHEITFSCEHNQYFNNLSFHDLLFSSKSKNSMKTRTNFMKHKFP